MVELIRESLTDIVQSASTAHAGLLIQRTLPVWEENEKTQKAKLIKKITSVKTDELYQLAFNRWIVATTNKPTFKTAICRIDGRLFTGLPLGGTLETGVATHHTYGVPLLAGSSIKGAVRSFATQIGLAKPVLETLFGAGDELDTEIDTDKVESNAGYIIFHDAWWVPETGNSPFAPEIVTVHHQKYYGNETQVADNTESPIPNQQLAVQGSFYFAIEGEKELASLAHSLLINMLSEQGVGSKTSSGYGYMVVDDKLQKEKYELATEIQDKLIGINDPTEIKIINEFIKKLQNTNKNWKGRPQEAMPEFDDFYNDVMLWDETNEYAQQALDTLLEYGQIWRGRKLQQIKKWKPMIQEFKKRFNLT